MQKQLTIHTSQHIFETFLQFDTIPESNNPNPTLAL